LTDVVGAFSTQALGVTGGGRDFAAFDVPLWVWAALVAAIAVMLAFDLLVVHRQAHVISLREAAVESAVPAPGRAMAACNHAVAQVSPSQKGVGPWPSYSW
jgi:hypothetical protein